MKKIIKFLIILTFSLTLLVACNNNEEVVKYVVSFDTNGGMPLTIDSQEVIKGEKAIKPTDPTKEGYEFSHWFSSELNKSFDFNLDLVNQNLNLVANYILDTSVFYELIIPSSVSTNITNLSSVKENTLVTLTVNIPENMELYEFKVNDLVINNTYYEFNIIEDTIVSVEFKNSETNEITYVEDFSVLQNWKNEFGYNSSDYLNYDYTGSYGFTYELINARVDLGMKQGDQGITLRGGENYLYEAGSGWIMLENIENGISMIEFTGRLPFSKNSTYPQGPGKDSSENVVISVYVNDILVQNLKFESNDKANKGQTFKLENLNFKGNSSFRIEVSSGHRLTIGSIKFISNIYGPEEALKTLVDFEGSKFVYDTSDKVYTFNNTEFVLKEIYTDQMDPDKEQAYMTSENGKVVGRFRGKNTAYIYNNNYFDKVESISFLAKQFGSNGFFAPNAVIKVFYQTESDHDFILVEEINVLPETIYELFTININKENVKVKIEVTGGTVNIDNINYYH